MIESILKYFAKRSKDVRMQMLLSSFYGILHCFGLPGLIAIVLKMTKVPPKEMEKARRLIYAYMISVMVVANLALFILWCSCYHLIVMAVHHVH